MKKKNSENLPSINKNKKINKQFKINNKGGNDLKHHKLKLVTRSLKFSIFFFHLKIKHSVLFY